MVETKKKIGISIDCDLYEQAKLKYPKISTRINELLAMDLYGSDEKDQLIKELHDLKIKEKAITKRICELEKEELRIEQSQSNKESVLDWVKEIYSRKGVVPLNKLQAECERHHVNFEEMKNYLELNEIATVNFG